MHPKRKTVLVVDDDQGTRETLTAILRGDFRVLRAATGEAGLALMDKEEVDVVLLDVQLPDATGFEICEFLCEDGPWPSIILVSSREAADYDGLLESSPARGFISKADLSGDTVRELLV